jgi:hypothetical protein
MKISTHVVYFLISKETKIVFFDKLLGPMSNLKGENSLLLKIFTIKVQPLTMIT